jgi:formate/nitrite transporter FocA (FNT family)
MFLFAGVSFAWLLLGFFVFEDDEPSAEEDKRVDWIGATMITVGLVLIVFVLSDLPTAPDGWKTPCEFTSTFFSKFIPT